MNLAVGKPRVEVVDALRGLAILSIMLLHNLEHFDLYYFPEYLPDWLKAVDGVVWSSLFFLFAGKSYAIFALLFGFTFYIQISNRQKEGKDFRGRFAWRLLLLLGFGAINSIFYQGDILAIYAVIGFVLIPVCHLKDKWVLMVGAILLLQPLSWINFVMAALDPVFIPQPTSTNGYFEQAAKHMSDGSFADMVVSNFTVGKMAVLGWTWEVGRVFQTAGIFMMGMLIGRRKLFVTSESSLKFWKYALPVAAATFLILYFGKNTITELLVKKSIRGMLDAILVTYTNLSFMVVLVSSFILLYQTNVFQKIASKLIPIGRMTLTNYVVQSILGATLYYGWGLGLYKYTGATFSLLIGMALVTLQILFCRWWLKSHKQGPLEGVWHRLTWIGTDKK